MVSNRVLSHQLSNGLYVSGTRDQYKDRLPTMTSTAMPYTGGDIKRSGELGKMFDIPVDATGSKKSGPLPGGVARGGGSFRAASSNSGPLSGNNPPRSTYSVSIVAQGSVSGTSAEPAGVSRQGSHSGPLSRNGDPLNARSGPVGVSLKTSGPLTSGALGTVRQNSGPLAPNLPATGLITSGPSFPGPLSASGASRKYSGPIDGGASVTLASGPSANQIVNNLSHNHAPFFTRAIPRVILWTVIPLFVIGLVAGGFILGAVQNAVFLVVVACLFGAILMLFTWNTWLGKGAVIGFVARYPEAGLGHAKDGQYVKVTGVVICGSMPLESSFQRVTRCVYTSSALYEYRGFKAKPARPKHRIFTWGLRYLERHVVDFYISDSQSGLRALVKAGHGAMLTPYVNETTIIDFDGKNRDLPSTFLRWLTERNLSSDDRVMRLQEGFIKEGSKVTVMGVIQRKDNVLMIVPPSEPVSTGCQWPKFLLPANFDGILLMCEDESNGDVIPV